MLTCTVNLFIAQVWKNSCRTYLISEEKGLLDSSAKWWCKWQNDNWIHLKEWIITEDFFLHEWQSSYEPNLRNEIVIPIKSHLEMHSRDVAN